MFTILFRSTKVAQAFTQANNKALLTVRDINAIVEAGKVYTNNSAKASTVAALQRRDVVISRVKANQVTFSYN